MKTAACFQLSINLANALRILTVPGSGSRLFGDVARPVQRAFHPIVLGSLAPGRGGQYGRRSAVLLHDRLLDGRLRLVAALLPKVKPSKAGND